MGEVEQSQRDGPVTEYVRTTWARDCWYPGGCVVLVVQVPAALILDKVHAWWLPQTLWQWVAVSVAIYVVVTVGVFIHGWVSRPARLAAAMREDRAYADLEAVLTQCPVCGSTRIAWGAGSAPARPRKGLRCADCGVRWLARWNGRRALEPRPETGHCGASDVVEGRRVV